MTEHDASEIVTSIRNTQENIALVIGVLFAVLLSVYFFTYAMAVDKGLMGVLWMMGISSIVFVVVLFRLQTVAFFLARVWLGRRSGFGDVFARLTATKS